MSYHYIKSRAAAKAITDATEAERKAMAQQINHQLEASRAWIDEYHTRPKRTAFNWSPRLTSKQEKIDGEKGQS